MGYTYRNYTYKEIMNKLEMRSSWSILKETSSEIYIKDFRNYIHFLPGRITTKKKFWLSMTSPFNLYYRNSKICVDWKWWPFFMSGYQMQAGWWANAVDALSKTVSLLMYRFLLSYISQRMSGLSEQDEAHGYQA